MTYLRLTTASLAILTLAACGGSNTPAPPPPNNAPSFTSTAAQDAPENSAGTIYTASATDADGDTLSYSISGGSDAALFSIVTNSGEVSFQNSPNFETPIDSNGDNIYNLTLTVTDGQGGADMLSLVITVTNVDQAFQIRRVGTGFSQSLYVQAIPDGSGRVLVLEKTGRIRVLNPNTGVIDGVDFLDISDDVGAEGEGGLLGMTLDPDFANNGAFYLNVTAGTTVAGDFRTEIRRYNVVAGRTDLADKATKDIILTIDQPFSNHNAGWIGFDENGLLYIPTGDGGAARTPNRNRAQDPDILLGKVLRLDVTADDFPADDLRDYAIPPGNAYPTLADGLPEIYAIGLRNPYRSSFDPTTGDLLIADVGQLMVEEVDRLPIDDSSFDFGWNTVEGTQDFNAPPQPSFTPPVTEYLHGNGPNEGNSITGGYVYTGPVEALQNEYVFGDFRSHNIWSVPVANLVNGQTLSADNFTLRKAEFTPDAGTIELIVSFGLDEDRNLYIVTIGGDVFRLEAEP